MSRGEIRAPDGALPPPGPPARECTPEEIREHVRRILASATFGQAAGPAKLLRFTVEETLAGRTNQIKEYTLGVSVFDRGTAFDPRIDTIVRVQARRLRAKLNHYYETEGKAEAVRIEYPKGNYVPVFRKCDMPLPPGPEPPHPSIAVLSFADLSSGQDQGYFSDGLTEELIHALSRIPGLNVLARTSVFHFKSGAADIGEIGARLNVQAVLEGSVRCSGPAIRVAVRLVDAASGFARWSAVYERRMEDLFAIQEDIARCVSAALRPQMAPAPLSGSPSHRTGNLEVYHLYLRGRHLWNQLGPKSLQRSIEYFQEALKLDNRYATAYAGLADAYIALAGSGFASPREVMPPAREASLRAIEIDDSLAEAHTSLAKIAADYDWNAEQAEVSFQRALSLNPGYATAHHWYGLHLAVEGHLPEAYEQVKIARRLDPLSPSINWSAAHMLHLLGRNDESYAQYLRAHELIPDNPDTLNYLLRSAAQRGMYAQLAPVKEQGCALPPLVSAGVLARDGRIDDARDILQRLELEARSQYVPPLALAHAWLAAGDLERCLDWLEQARAERQALLLGIDDNPACAPLRTHPRFQQLLASIEQDRHRLVR